MQFQLERLQSAALQALSRRFFLDIRRLVEKHRPKRAAEDQKLLNTAMEFIRAEPEVAKWDITVREQFVSLACEVLTAELRSLDHSEFLKPVVVKDFQSKADWLLNLAAGGSDDNKKSKLNACGFWLRSRLLNGLESISISTEAALTALANAGLNVAGLDEQIKLTAVSHVAGLDLSSEVPPETIEQVKNWCRELLELEQFRQELYGPAIKLGVELPTVAAPPEPPKTNKHTLGLWTLPDLPSAEMLEEQKADLIFDLLTVLSAMTSETAQGIDTLSKGVEGNFARQFHFAARDLWQSFYKRGDRSLLPLIKRVALFCYATEVHEGAPEHHRRGTFRLWINAQIPDLMLAWPVKDLVREMAAAHEAAGVVFNDAESRVAIIESFAGEARARETEGDNSGRQELVEENREALHELHREYIKLHREYVQRTKQANREPNQDELASWEYLYPSPIIPPELPGPVDRIIKDANFQMVVRRGDHDEMYEFVTERREDIQKLLFKRLDVSFGPETLMQPTGPIYNPRSRTKNTHDPRFVEAKDLLAKEQYAQAAVLFGRLADQQDGTPRDIACDYWAYALAKQKIPSAAREKLAGLSDKYRFASAYWNQACCYSSAQNDLRLEVLERGLARSPHPKLLFGAVFLSLLVNDTNRLKKLLPFVPFTEALLIYYQVAFDELDAEKKEKQIGRLVGYALNEEVEWLDPLKSNLKPADIEKMLELFQERRHLEPIEFWMRCRETISYHRFDYWQIKTDYMEKAGAAAEAAKAFKEEVRCRLGSLQRVMASKNPLAKGQANYLRRRVEHWLALCQTPDLRSTGWSIYTTILKFKDDNEAALRELEIDLEHRDRFKRYFGEPVTNGDRREEKLEVSDGRVPAGAFEAVLIRASSVCESQLHTSSDVPLVRTQLEEFGEALSRHKFVGSARELALVMQRWNNYEKETTDEGRLGAFHEAQKTFKNLQSEFSAELTGNLLALAQPVLKALNRVTNRLLRDTKLVPKVSVETLSGNSIEIDLTGSNAAFPVRVRNHSDSAGVRIKKATAEFAGNLLECLSRDKFDALPVTAEAGQSAVLTFSLPPNLAIDQDKQVRIIVRYEYAGSEYESEPKTAELLHRPVPELPSNSPYIYGRMIEPEEIEGHFFGRETEQREVLDSVRGGQQRFLYIEGIRHSGKSSLLQSIQHEISLRDLPFVPVYYSMGSTQTVKTIGGIISNIFARIIEHPILAAKGIAGPDEDKCNQNMPSTYSAFLRQLSEAVPDRKILVLADEMHSLAEAGRAARDSDPALFSGIVGLLNLIRDNGRPSAALLWVFAGQIAKSQFSSMVPGASLWAQLRSLQIDFLPVSAAESIIRAPLEGSAIDVPYETVRRVHQHTAGHPEVMQQIAELMLFAAKNEKRTVLTPADADKAAEDLAHSSDHLFAETWYPAHLLSADQAELIAMLVAAVPPGDGIELFRLTKEKRVTEAVDIAVKDLVARKIVVHEGGIIKIKAYVLDLWLRRWVAKLVGTHHQGAPAFFLDLANLTEGKGTPYIANLQTKLGEGIPGRFTWPTVLDRIDRYAKTFTPARFAAKWAINYPAGSPAVTEVSSRDYLVENLPPGIRRKENDDRVLAMKIQDTERMYPNASHYFLVLGDGDYEVALDWLIKRGKFVHVCSRERGEADIYRQFAQRYPSQVTYKSLEDILDDSTLQPN